MTRWRVAPAGPAAVDTCGLHIPPGGIERELDADTLRLLSGDARVTVEEAAPEAREEAQAAQEAQEEAQAAQEAQEEAQAAQEAQEAARAAPAKTRAKPR